MNEIVIRDEWFTHLIKEIDHLYIQTKYNMGIDLVHYYHQLGELIVKENGNFERKKVYGKHILELVRKSLEQWEKPIRISISQLYRAKQFYTQNPDWEKFVSTFSPDKKGITWHDVCQKCLPLPKEMKEEKQNNGVEEAIKKITLWLEKLLDKFGGKALEDILGAVEEKIRWIKEESRK